MGSRRRPGRRRPEPRGHGARGRDEPVFEDLVRAHSDVVWRFAVGMLRDPDDADDVTQDTFLRVYRSLGGFRGEAAQRTWILAICRNLCIDRLRARRPDTVPLDDALRPRDDRPDGGDHAPGVVARAALAEGLTDLDAAEREAFVLVDVLGFSGAEAAAVCDVPATTLRSRRQRAHRHLVRHLTGGAT